MAIEVEDASETVGGYTITNGAVIGLGFWRRLKFLFTNRLQIVSHTLVAVLPLIGPRATETDFTGVVLGREEAPRPLESFLTTRPDTATKTN